MVQGEKSIFSHKKAAGTAAGAATLVALIALFILLYILFLPPAERRALLEDEEINGGTSTTNDTFLLETPGSLDDVRNEDIQHNIPSVNLFATQEAKSLAQTNQIFVKRSIITEKNTNFSFTIKDLANTDNVLLTFAAPVRKGELRIILNGQEIFFGPLEQENPSPIRLSKDLLQNGLNSLSFSVTPVGLKFWRVNEYQLQNVQITADVTDISQQLSQNVFIVSTTERNNVERVILKFTPECVLGTVGVLDVSINGQNVFSAVPDCGGTTVVEVSPTVIRNNENRIIFKTNKGNYLIDLIRITSELQEARQPAFYFEIPQDVYDNAVIEDGYDILLNMEFADGANQKEGVILVNGRQIGLFQREREFSAVINDYLLEGNNAIKIIPDSPLDIVKLEVVAE